MRSLHARSHRLSSTQEQNEILEGISKSNHCIPAFHEKLSECGMSEFVPATPEILQVNIGYMCNQTCAHCHVDAGPDRKERMDEATMQACLNALKKYSFTTLDITGGAPEMHPGFRSFVERAAQTGIAEIIVRSNLTILVSNPTYNSLPEFFAANKVRICSSLPFYNSVRTDRQRGRGVFEKSICALKMLNQAGYGDPDSGLIIDLVYNPSGAFLPGDQTELEKEFKVALKEKYGIGFNRLLTITNVPVSRFLDYLITSGNAEAYLEKLVMAFNPATFQGLMCRNTISVDWQGNLYDCDFNQMLGLKMKTSQDRIFDFDLTGIKRRQIVTGLHCYACTAGAGSSCQGATA
ncbi:MAG: arsenosugar biosynthesis radical SAM (seleno)protein ArsS [Cyclobacteriaceae bacterium]